MELTQNFETTILTKCHWSEKQSAFYGTLIYNIENTKSEPIADIICRRDNQGVTVEWFIPNQDGQKISLAYLRDSNSLDTTKTDSEIKNQKDVLAFLDNIDSTINKTTGDFFPKEKIIVQNKNKLHI